MAPGKVAAKKKSETPPSDVVGDYLAALRPPANALLVQLRQLIHTAVPGLAEGLTYKIPAFKLNGRQVVSMGPAKGHGSLYFMNSAVIEAHRTELHAYKTSKGVVQFPFDQALPRALIVKLVRAAAKAT